MSPKSSSDIFDKAISTAPVPDIFKPVEHNQKPQGCLHGKEDAPIQTNNFYNNMTLDDQTYPIWTLPYSLWLTKDPDAIPGLAINHTEASQRVMGPDPNAPVAQYYFNPPKIKSIVFSGDSLTQSNVNLSFKDHAKMSVTAIITPGNESKKFITFPLVQGMGFCTAIYQNISPIIASQVGFQEFKKLGVVNGMNKYYAMLFNQVKWSFYVSGNVELQLKDHNTIIGKGDSSNVTIQCCRGESRYYDDSCGCYATSCSLKASQLSDDGRSYSYTFDFGLKGSSKSRKSIFWALPHHQETLSRELEGSETNLYLDSPTKGIMRAYVTDCFIMKEMDLPIYVMYEPWSSLRSFSGTAKYSKQALVAIKEAAVNDVRYDVEDLSNIDSMYTSGKILDRFAYVAYVCAFILKDNDLTNAILPKVKRAIERFAFNKQKNPLVYDMTWKGLISSADPAADFGNSNYNDHHFHYGYHIHAIALTAKVDQKFGKGDWLNSNNKCVYNYALTLIRDVANPSKNDKYFPTSRSFDWFHGHSFAHGIFASGDGKDEESSSEDYHFAYGMKLYADVIGNRDMKDRANLMLAIMKRSMNMYMLFSDDNVVQPKNFIKNKVAGISFENKIDYATYFGRGQIGDEWIHGIHMLPITPISSYIRHEKFVKEEWDQKLAPIIDKITDGWKGILMLNYALVDPKVAWNWFCSDSFHESLIDNGMSKTWSLAYIAGIVGNV